MQHICRSEELSTNNYTVLLLIFNSPPCSAFQDFRDGKAIMTDIVDLKKVLARGVALRKSPDSKAVPPY